MKSLNLAQPLVMMMVGLPGAGKSAFAKSFSKMFGAPVVSADRLRYELFSNPQYSAEEQDILQRLMQYQIEELLKTNQTIIIDGNCNTKTERLKIKQLAKKAGYTVLAVWVQTHETTARNRAGKRNPRRTEDAYNISLSREQFDAQKRRLTPPATEDYVVVSGMHTYNTQAKTVLRKIVAAREVAANSAHKTEVQANRHQPRPENPTRRSVTIH